MDFYFHGTSRRITASEVSKILLGAGLPPNTSVALFVEHINSQKTRYDYLVTTTTAPEDAIGASVLSPSMRMRHQADYQGLALPTVATAIDQGSMSDLLSLFGVKVTQPKPGQTRALAGTSTGTSTVTTQPVTSVNLEVSQMVANALSSVNLVPIHLFEFDGFDPMKIRREVLRLGGAATAVSESLGESIKIDLHGPNVHNDLNIMITLGLMRGNSVTKILRKSHQHIVNVIRRLDTVYQLSASTGMLSLMRIVNSFPDVALPTLLAGRGRNIVPEFTLDLVMANPVSFQAVKKSSFGKYAGHFFALAYLIDKVVNKGKTSHKNLWNYMVMAYNSPVYSPRMDDIGEPNENPFSAVTGLANDLKAEIEKKIAENDASVLE